MKASKRGCWAKDGCDFAVILEDDVRVNRWLRHNLQFLPLLCRDQCDYLSLFMPDLIASPWQRQEAHLGYRLAKPLYSGPNRCVLELGTAAGRATVCLAQQAKRLAVRVCPKSGWRRLTYRSRLGGTPPGTLLGTIR